MNMYVGIDYS